MNKINATVGVRVDMMIKIGHGKWNPFNAHASAGLRNILPIKGK